MKFHERFDYAEKLMSVVKRIIKGASLKSVPSSILSRVSYDSDYPFLMELIEKFPTISFHSNQNYGYIVVKYGIVYHIELPNDGRSSQFCIYAEAPFSKEAMCYRSNGNLSDFKEWITKNELHTELNELQHQCKYGIEEILAQAEEYQKFSNSIDKLNGEIFIQPNDVEQVIINSRLSGIVGVAVKEGSYVPFTQMGNHQPSYKKRGILIILNPLIIKLFYMSGDIMMEVENPITGETKGYQRDGSSPVEYIENKYANRNFELDKLATNAMESMKKKFQVELDKFNEDKNRDIETFKDYVYLIQQNFQNVTINPFNILIVHEGKAYEVERMENSDYEIRIDRGKTIGTFQSLDELENLLKQIFWNKSFVSRIKSLM